MSAAPAASVEKVPETKANDVAATTTSNDVVNDKTAATEAAATSVAEGRRLYIGNVPYETKEEELKEFFKSYLIESVSIPRNPRTDRPVGYAFVDVSTPSEAERAIAELSGKVINERKVSVQPARKLEAEAKKERTGADTTQRSSGRSRGRGKARGTRSGQPKNAEDDNNESKAANAAAAPATAAVAPVTDGQALKDVTNQAPQEQGAKLPGDDKARSKRPRREAGPPPDGIPSKTKVMVANLPYDLTSEKLTELFQEYQPLSAKIALRPIPRFMIKKLNARGEARKGRGFGFVDLASEELQQKAVSEMNGKQIEGREIAVKVAIDSPDKKDNDTDAPTDENDGNDEAAPTTEATKAAPAAASTTEATTPAGNSTDAAAPTATTATPTAA